MAVTETRTLPAQFVEDLGTDLAKQLVAQSVFLLYQQELLVYLNNQVKLQNNLQQDKKLLNNFKLDNKVYLDLHHK
jgi:hypothetical protein